MSVDLLKPGLSNYCVKPLSYYVVGGGRQVTEYLVDHIDRMLKYVASGSPRLLKFLRRYLGDATQDFMDVVKLAIVLHDTGKVFTAKLRKLDDTEYLSFIGHEVVSTYILYLVFNELMCSNLFQDLEKVLRWKSEGGGWLGIASFAIIYHHHPMSVENRIYALQLSRTSRECWNGLRELATKLPNGNLRRAFLSVVDKAPKISAYIKSEVRGITKAIWDEYLSNPKFRRLSLLALSILTSLDYTASWEVRGRPGGGRSLFSRVAEEFIRYYLLSSA